MKKSKIARIASAITLVYETSKVRFPYDDCWKIGAGKGKLEGFTADLDLHTLYIAGYAHSADNILNWSETRLSEMEVHLQKSFFEKHPRLLKIEKKITLRRTPALYEYLCTYEWMRVQLLRLLPLVAQKKH